MANKRFTDQNPAVAKLLPVGDINAQNLAMKNGQAQAADIGRHANGWIRAHQKTFDGWIAQALAAAGK